MNVNHHILMEGRAERLMSLSATVRTHLLRFATVSGASGFQAAALALLGILTGKFLSVDDFGITRTVTAYVVFLTVIGEVCLHDSVAAYVAGSDSQAERGKYIVNGSYMVIGASFLLVLIMEVVLATNTVWTGELRKTMMAVFAFLPAVCLGMVYMSVLPALGEHKKLSVNYLLNGSVPLLLIGCGAYAWELDGWTAARCLAYLFFLGFTVRQVYRYISLERPDRRAIKDLWGFARIHIIGGVISMWFINADIIVMERFSTSMQDVANYAMGSMFAKSIMIFPATLGRVYFRNISRSLASLERFTVIIVKLLAVTVASCIVIAALLYATAPYVISLLFGDRFQPSVQIMRILCFGIVFKGIWNILTPIMVASKNPKVLLGISLVATVVSLVLFYYWIPAFGAVGAAWAMNLAYMVSAAFGCFVLFVHKKRLLKGSVPPAEINGY